MKGTPRRFDFDQSLALDAVDLVSVPRDELEVHILPGAPEAIVERFLRGDRVLFPRHALDTDASVPGSTRR